MEGDCGLYHPWSLAPREAADLQRSLRPRVEHEDRLPPLRRVAGLDVGFEAAGQIARAAVAALSFPDLSLLESAVVREPTDFPYVPGLLSFREVPSLLAALAQLATLPDLLVCDGHGYAHPRRFGLACHLGVATGLPSIGVAKSRLVGEHAEPGPERGDRAPLVHLGQEVGMVLRTRRRVRPVYVSVGHRVSLETAVELVLQLAPRFRLPETTRQADRLTRTCCHDPLPRR